MVSRSKEFYDELRGTTAEQVGLQLPFRENEMGGKRCYASRLVDLCYWWGWTHNGTILSTTLRVSIYGRGDTKSKIALFQSLLRIMGPECESKILDDRYLHALQLNTYDLAQTKNFSGGESNRYVEAHVLVAAQCVSILVHQRACARPSKKNISPFWY